jgi:hypothetical protein
MLWRGAVQVVPVSLAPTGSSPPFRPMQQLDIFADSRDVALRNDLAQALLDADMSGALRAAAALRLDFAADSILAPAALLIEHLQAAQGPGAAQLLEVAAVADARS